MDNVIDTGTLAGSDISAPATPAIPGDTTVGSPISGQTQAPAIPGAAQGGPGEGWVPSYRIREAREAAVRQANEYYAQREASIRAEAEQYRQKLHALAGVTPPPDPQTSAVRQQFGQLYPGLSKIEERAAQIMEMLDRAGDIDSQQSHYWQSYGRQAMDRLFTHASQATGAPLSDEAKRVLHASFTGFVQSSPELTERYANDPSLIEDFWRVFSSSFIDPSRRAATTTAVGRAAGQFGIPQDTPGGVPRATPAPQMGSLDDRAASAWATYQTLRK